MSKKDISFIIPCYKSGQALRKTIEDIDELSRQNNFNYEVILVCDCPNDQGKTWLLLKEIANSYEEVVCVSLTSNVGQQMAVLCGFEQAQGKLIVTLDDDGQHNVSDVPLMIKAMGDNDLVIAKLKDRKVSLLRRLGSLIVKKVTRVIFDLENNISFSSFRVINSRVLKNLKTRTTQPVVGFELLRLTSRVINFEVNHCVRGEGVSTYSFWSLCMYFFTMVINYSNFLPKFSIFISGLFSVLSLVLFITYLSQYFLGYLNQPGFATLVVMITLSFSLLFFVISLMVSYILKIHSVITNIPRFSVSEAYSIKGEYNDR